MLVKVYGEGKKEDDKQNNNEHSDNNEHNLVNLFYYLADEYARAKSNSTSLHRRIDGSRQSTLFFNSYVAILITPICKTSVILLPCFSL